MLLAAVGVLCGLAMTVLVAFAARSAVATIGAALIGLLVATLQPWSVLTAESMALTALAGTAAGLWRPSRPEIPALCGGMLAYAWTNVLVAQGLPLSTAAAIVVLVATATGMLTRLRPQFATAALLDEALAIVAVLATTVAAAPAVTAGYATAVGLRAAPLGEPSISTGPGALIFAAVFVVAGGLYALWRSR